MPVGSSSFFNKPDEALQLQATHATKQLTIVYRLYIYSYWDYNPFITGGHHLVTSDNHSTWSVATKVVSWCVVADDLYTIHPIFSIVKKPLVYLETIRGLLATIWVWVKIRYPNNWMVNTKLDIHICGPTSVFHFDPHPFS